MLFSHPDIIQALAGGDLNDPEYFAAVYQKLVLDRPDGPDKQAALQTNGKDPSDYPLQFKLFLTEDLPSSESVPSLVAVWKIVFKLIFYAAESDAVIKDFYWWNIRPKLRALVATLTREGHVFNVYFYWKKTNKDEVHPMNRGCRTTCSLQPNVPGVLRLEFDAEAYQEMRAAYEHWLKSPLVLPQGFSKKTAEPSCPADCRAPD